MAKEIPLTRGQFAIVDDEDYIWLNQWKWCAIKREYTWYAERRELKSISGKILRMHRVIIGARAGELVDHINGNGLDNRRTNIRICTHSQNLMNSSNKKNCSSKFKGVYWHKKGRKWAAQIQMRGSYKYLGLFSSEIDAAIAYNNAAIENFGEFARLNAIE